MIYQFQSFCIFFIILLFIYKFLSFLLVSLLFLVHLKKQSLHFRKCSFFIIFRHISSIFVRIELLISSYERFFEFFSSRNII